MKTPLLFIAVIFLSAFAACSQSLKNNPKAASKPFVAMFYNVENLYDTQNDPETDDDEFTPSGKVPWTGERLQIKIDHIGQVMTDIASPSMPDLVGFAEVENKEVLQMLVASASLKKAKYAIVHFDSQDERGIDVGLLYNPAAFKILTSEPMPVVLHDNDRTRDILYVKGKVNSGEILHIFINHWPSRREGTELSEPKRMAAAMVLRDKIDAIFRLDKAPNILIMGDFNDEPLNNSITKGLKALSPNKPFDAKSLYSLLFSQFKKGEGSLYYKDWDLFDQIIVSGNMMMQKKGLHTSTNEAGIFKAEYLLFRNKSGDARPNRTMGERYFGGYSDHLPVYVKIFL